MIGVSAKALVTGSEDTTFKVLHDFDDHSLILPHLRVTQTFSQHEASVRAFAKTKISHELLDETHVMLRDATHLVVSAGSKMQAHLFAAVPKDGSIALIHLCRYNQQLFKAPTKVGRKEFEASTDT